MLLHMLEQLAAPLARIYLAGTQISGVVKLGYTICIKERAMRVYVLL